MSSCQETFRLLQEEKPNLNDLENAVFHCVYGADPDISKQIESVADKSVMDCWKIKKGDAPPFSGALKTHCEKIYDGSGEPQLEQKYPWEIDANDPFYICYGEYDPTLKTKGEGFLGRCWAESECSALTCIDESSIELGLPSDVYCSDGKVFRGGGVYFVNADLKECSPILGDDSASDPARVCDDYLTSTDRDLSCWTDWEKNDEGPIAFPTADPRAWNRTGGGTDACIEYAEYDYCQSLAIPEVIDPSSQVFATGDTYNIPAALIDSGVYTQLNVEKPLLNMSGYIKYVLPTEQDSSDLSIPANGWNYGEGDVPQRPDGPRGVLFDVASDLRIGIMSFNDNGSKSECDFITDRCDPISVNYACGEGSDTYNEEDCEYCSSIANIDKFCPDTNKDGAKVVTPIEIGMVVDDSATPGDLSDDLEIWDHHEELVRSINGTKATAWTPLAEALFNALGYYGQNRTLRLDEEDFLTKAESDTDSLNGSWPDPVQYYCQDNHILIITEGASTADVNEEVILFATENGDDDGTDTTCPDGLEGSTYLDDLTWFGQNATVSGSESTASNLYDSLIETGKPEPAWEKQPVTTHFVTTGALSEDGTGECSSATIMRSAAENGGSNLLTGENPDDLERNLRAAFTDILGRASAGSAASVISSSRSGEGAVYQAIFWPKVDRGLDKDPLSWIGDVHGLFIDDQGRMWDDYSINANSSEGNVKNALWSEDRNGNGRLDVLDGEDIDGNGCLDGDRRIFYYFDGQNTNICFNDSVTTSDPPVCDQTLSGYCGVYTEPVGVKEFDQYLWSAQKQLEEIGRTGDDDLLINRTIGDGSWVWTPDNPKRYIFTWNDLDQNGIAEQSEVFDLVDAATDLTAKNPLISSSPVPPSILSDFGVSDEAELKKFITWMRGMDAWYEDDLDSDGIFDITDDLLTNEDLNLNGKQDYVYRCRRFPECVAPSAADEGLNPEWRLGDVIHSTPKLVGQPAEAYHTIYRDASYGSFIKRYRWRRNVIYFGANDGMLHAVNGGFYDSKGLRFWSNVTFETFIDSETGESTTRRVYNDNDGLKLGGELWAYVPYNLQPHLKCLSDPDYTNKHKYFVDKEPRVFDMKIFEEEPECSDPYDQHCIHPGGWGTVLVGAMRFGGDPITAGTDSSGNWPDDDPRQFISSYFILDITNPERPPVLLGEVTRTTDVMRDDDDVPIVDVNGDTIDMFADMGFSTPTVTGVVMRDILTNTESFSNWYLIMGNGPTTLKGENNQQGKIAVMPMKWLNGVKNNAGPVPFRIPNSAPPLGDANGGGIIEIEPKIIDSDNNTEITESFVSDLITVDLDLETEAHSTLGGLYKSDAVYFGTVDGSGFASDSDGNTYWPGGGRAYRLVTRILDGEGKQDVTTPDEWKLKKLIDAQAPVSGALSVGWDGSNYWFYFGTGRFFDVKDKTDNTTQRFFGVKEPMFEMMGGFVAGFFLSVLSVFIFIRHGQGLSSILAGRLGRRFRRAEAQSLAAGRQVDRLAVNGQPDNLFFMGILPRQFYGKFHPLAAVLLGGHIDLILVRCQNLFQNMA